MFGFRGFGGQCVNAVDVASVEDGRVGSVDQVLCGSEHVSRVEGFNLNAVDLDLLVDFDRVKVRDSMVTVQSIVNVSRLASGLFESLVPESTRVVAVGVGD